MTKPLPSTSAVQQRVIRVFVSSTFRDMQAEREELVKRVFPQLRKLCEERGVTWGEVDLRWGVTDEQKSEGQVLPICLAEIRRCRPYFIGLLGERYGWVPDEFPPALLDDEGWLGERRGRSVTELEILQGVLNDSAMAEHAFFYFRSPACLDSLPPEQRPAFQESPAPEDIAQFGSEEAMRRAEERRHKLAALKERIRGSGLPVREDYPDPRALGESVLADLTSVIERVFPAGSAPEPLDREAADQETFARSRARVYIGRPDYFDRLDAHARHDGPPLVLLGESGSGKSALLANWAVRHRAARPDDLLVQHFIGATPASADWASMLRRILGECNRRFGLALDMPDKPDALRTAFANALHRVAARGRVVLILDALNQLDDRDQAPDLVWLPPEIPGNVRLILSTLPGRPLDDLKKRGWPTLEVEPLTTSERKQLVDEYLAQYTKSLSAGRAERIAAAPQSANPLYLRALLEELRLWREHETLEGRIDHYLSATTVAELYRRILERYEQDYERDRPGLVRDAASLLWAARRGLSETELLDMLGSDGQPMPRAPWSQLYLAAEQSLVNRSGLIGFFHDYLRKAVQDRYLPTGDAQTTAHLQLADYFAKRELTHRKVDELPWQLMQACAWQPLYTLLADLPFFQEAWKANQFEVKAQWAQVEANSPLRMVDAYRPFLAAAERRTDYAWTVGDLLQDTGHLEEAATLREYLAAHYRRTGDRASLQGVLGAQALILQVRGDLDGAIALHKEEERLCRELGNKEGLERTLGNQALVLQARGDLHGAMALHKEEERLCRELGNKHGLQVSLGHQALVLQAQGDSGGAMTLLREVERLCRELGSKDGLTACLGNQAGILLARGDLDGTMKLYKEVERLCRELGHKEWLSGSLGNQALILLSRGELDGAMALLEEQEWLCRELGSVEVLTLCLGNQAMVLAQQPGGARRGLALADEAARLAEEHGLTALAERVTPVLDYVRAECRKALASPQNLNPLVVDKLDFAAVDWRNDAALQGRFHPEARDDVQVLVHDGHPGLSGRGPEVVWVRICGKRDGAYRGIVKNQPLHLASVHNGDDIFFVAPPGFQYLIQVSQKYLEERTTWDLQPCTKCGLPECFEAPSEMLKHSQVPPEARGEVPRITVPCPMCDGVQIFVRKGIALVAPPAERTPPPKKKAWWKFGGI